VHRADFFFELPESLIAQFPSQRRGEDRLLCLDRRAGQIAHHQFKEIPHLIDPNSLLVFNNSRVRKARIFARSLDTGSEQEFLLLEEQRPAYWKCMVRRAKRQRLGREYEFPQGLRAKIVGIEAEFCYVQFDSPFGEEYLEEWGHIPLPPYIRRSDESIDAQRYQTIYAAPTGSAAAPTAGLHFTQDILAAIKERGIEFHFVTLHVGLGTFLPVRAEKIEEHQMHEEAYVIDREVAEAVNRARREGRPILAVGTTSVRTLESAGKTGLVEPGPGRTSIFIYPGYTFSIVDQLLTNFHTPESTLLMLVSAFAGRDTIMAAYSQAIEREYRFFSYGDAMLIK
jgi:S-adenosylmethionine:tRNA ribosyltransferase-isomerase